MTFFARSLFRYYCSILWCLQQESDLFKAALRQETGFPSQFCNYLWRYSKAHAWKWSAGDLLQFYSSVIHKFWRALRQYRKSTAGTFLWKCHHTENRTGNFQGNKPIKGLSVPTLPPSIMTLNNARYLKSYNWNDFWKKELTYSGNEAILVL